MSTMLADLIDAHNRLVLADRIIYAVSEQVTPGKVLIIKETDYDYGFMLFHSDEEAQQVALSTGRTLLHARDAPRKPFRGFVSSAGRLEV